MLDLKAKDVISLWFLSRSCLLYKFYEAHNSLHKYSVRPGFASTSHEG